jgi:pimeloyl-ACP methyl ester carboxylesterase
VSLAAEYAAFLAAHPPRQLTIAGARWELIEAGSGPVVALLPGGFGVAATSFQYVAGLSCDHRAIALTYPPNLDRIADLADGVAEVLNACGAARAHVVGGSASGAVAQALVRRHPGLVATLVLAQTGPPRPGRAGLALACAALCDRIPAPLALALLRAAMLAFLPRPSASHAFWRWHFAAVAAAGGRAELAARFRALADYDHSYRFAPGDLAGWPGRVVILEAARDGLLPASERAALRALYPGAAVELIAGGHNASVTDPGPQLAALRRALGASSHSLSLMFTL